MSSIKKDATAQQNADAYWKDTLKLLWIVLALWAVVSFQGKSERIGMRMLSYSSALRRWN